MDHDQKFQPSVAYMGPLPTHSSHIELAGSKLAQTEKVLNNHLM